MLSPWLQGILGACALAITIASILVGYGRNQGKDEASIARLSDRVDAIDEEILRLRTQRHDENNKKAAVLAYEFLIPEMMRKIERLEARVYNGGPR